MNCTLAATETFNRRNGNARSRRRWPGCRRSSRPPQMPATATISVAFGCPFEGRVDPAGWRSLRSARRGRGRPRGHDRRRDAARGARRWSSAPAPVGVHLHNTRNTGYANALAAIEPGATVLDASVGGLGGCPYAPRATGNVATEDLVYLLEGEGVETGVDLDALIASRPGWRASAGSSRATSTGPATSRGGVAERLNREVVSSSPGLPVGDRDADRLAAVPRRAAEPDPAARLYAREHLVLRSSRLEAEQHLVEHDVVQRSRRPASVGDPAAKRRGRVAAALDELHDAAAAERAQRGVDGEPARAARELRHPVDLVAYPSRALVLDQVRRP